MGFIWVSVCVPHNSSDSGVERQCSAMDLLVAPRGDGSLRNHFNLLLKYWCVKLKKLENGAALQVSTPNSLTVVRYVYNPPAGLWSFHTKRERGQMYCWWNLVFPRWERSLLLFLKSDSSVPNFALNFPFVTFLTAVSFRQTGWIGGPKWGLCFYFVTQENKTGVFCSISLGQRDKDSTWNKWSLVFLGEDCAFNIWRVF